MPSRRPRSAMRRRSDGNARRIASRMAQPASTRSARSRPMQGFCGALVERRVEQVVENRGHMLVAHPHAVDPPPVVARQLEVDAADRRDGSRGAEQVELRGDTPPSRPRARTARRRSLDLLDHGLERHPRHVDAAVPLGERHHPDRQRVPGPDALDRVGERACPLAVEPGDLGRAAADVEDDHRMGARIGERRAAGDGEIGLGAPVDDLELACRARDWTRATNSAPFSASRHASVATRRARVALRCCILLLQTRSASMVRSIAASLRRFANPKPSPSRTMREKASMTRKP